MSGRRRRNQKVENKLEDGFLSPALVRLCLFGRWAVVEQIPSSATCSSSKTGRESGTPEAVHRCLGLHQCRALEKHSHEITWYLHKKKVSLNQTLEHWHREGTMETWTHFAAFISSGGLEHVKEAEDNQEPRNEQGLRQVLPENCSSLPNFYLGIIFFPEGRTPVCIQGSTWRRQLEAMHNGNTEQRNWEHRSLK